MKKALLIIGPADSGKSRLVKSLLDGSPYLYADGRHGQCFEQTFPWEGLRPNDRFVFIDDLPLFYINRLYPLIVNGEIDIARRGRTLVQMEFPQIIVTMRCELQDLPESAAFNERFTVFKMDQVYISMGPAARSCRICGCTDMDCSQCVERTGEPCHWVEANLCSACVAHSKASKKSKTAKKK